MINIIKKWIGLDYYYSELDQFLAHFNKTSPKLSLSQRKEREKYARIYRLRDYPSDVTQESFWDNF